MACLEGTTGDAGEVLDAVASSTTTATGPGGAEWTAAALCDDGANGFALSCAGAEGDPKSCHSYVLLPAVAAGTVSDVAACECGDDEWWLWVLWG